MKRLLKSSILIASLSLAGCATHYVSVNPDHDLMRIARPTPAFVETTKDGKVWIASDKPVILVPGMYVASYKAKPPEPKLLVFWRKIRAPLGASGITFLLCALWMRYKP